MKRKPIQSGYTLVEMAVAMSIGLMVAILVLALVNQQVAFNRIFTTQNFLTTEAPVISENVTALCSRADGFRLYNSKENALAGAGAVMADAPVAELRFQQSDGVVRRALLSFEDLGAGAALNYYVVSAAGAIGAAPDMKISGRPSRVRFAMEAGLLRVRITGPHGEEITYCATTQT
jgi:prepilin-type N-terminal cleavage/methylation domain-containing protein